MSIRTIGPDGNDEPRTRPADTPVEYLICLGAKLTAEAAAEFEDCEEVILRHPTKPALIRARVIKAEVMQ